MNNQNKIEQEKGQITKLNEKINDDYEINFCKQAGLTQEQIKALQFQPVKRQTRNHKNIVEEKYTNIELQKSFDSSNKSSIVNKSINTISNDEQFKNKQIQKKVVQLHKVIKRQHYKRPQNAQQLMKSYQIFAHIIFPNQQNYKQEIEWFKNNIFFLFQLLIETLNFGGIQKLISQGYKKQIFQHFVDKYKISSSDQVFRIYKKYLYFYQNDILNKYNFKNFKDPTNNFFEAKFVFNDQLRKFLSQRPLDPLYFQEDIIVFRQGQQAINVDSNEISLDRVSERYKDYNVDIRIQKPMDYGFNPRKLRNQPYQMKIQNYRTYQRLCQQYSEKNISIDQNFYQRLGPLAHQIVNQIKFKDRIKQGEIFFAVNFDPQDGLLYQHILQKVKGTFFGFKQSFDLLSYLDHQIPGCSFPQFYFKVKGVWTGGHQQNINMCAVNINHGPDSSQWFTMEYKYVEQFRTYLKQKQKIDLYGNQGLWYQRLQWFIDHGWPVKKIIQKKGDIVISGPGTLHWVRSHGIALQSAWNLFPITLNSLTYAFNRQQQNQKIKFIRSNVIPLKMLILKFLNHQSQFITQSIKCLCLQKINMWLKNQNNLYQELLEKNEFFGEEMPRYEKLDDTQGFCQECRQQIFLYFVNGNNTADIVCLNCYKQNQKLKRKSKRVFIRHIKYDILNLIRLTKNGKKFKQIQSLCNGPYVGNLNIQCSKKIFKTQKDQIFINRINKMNQRLNKLSAQQCNQRKLKLIEKQKQKQKQLQNNNQLIYQNQHCLQHHGDKIIQQPKQDKIIDSSSKDTLKVPQKQIKNIRGRNFVGQPSQEGFWPFILNQNETIINIHNHQQILKQISNQQRHVKKKYGQKYNFPYFVCLSREFQHLGIINQKDYQNKYRNNYNLNSSNQKNDLMIQAQFSQNQEEEINKKINESGYLKSNNVNKQYYSQKINYNYRQRQRQNQKQSRVKDKDRYQKVQKAKNHRSNSKSSLQSKSNKQKSNYRSRSRQKIKQRKHSKSKQRQRQKTNKRNSHSQQSKRSYKSYKDQKKHKDKKYQNHNNKYSEIQQYDKNNYNRRRDNKNRNNEQYKDNNRGGNNYQRNSYKDRNQKNSHYDRNNNRYYDSNRNQFRKDYDNSNNYQREKSDRNNNFYNKNTNEPYQKRYNQKVAQKFHQQQKDNINMKINKNFKVNVNVNIDYDY